MPIRKVPNSDLNYYLLIYDENGQDRAEADGFHAESEGHCRSLSAQPVTDVFLMSHGWMGDIPAAISQYDSWTGNLMSASADIEDMKNGVRVPAVVGRPALAQPALGR